MIYDKLFFCISLYYYTSHILPNQDSRFLKTHCKYTIISVTTYI